MTKVTPESDDPQPNDPGIALIVAKAEALTHVVAELRDELSIAEHLIAKSQILARRSQTWIRLTVVGILLDLTLTLFGGALYLQINNNSERITRVQTTISQEVICPLYGLLLGTYHPERQPTSGQETYEQFFAIIRSGSVKLGCNRSK